MRSWHPRSIFGSLLIAGALALGACDSNPTPHPAQDSFKGGTEDTREPNVAAPDQDGDGVDDCAENGQFWDGSMCRADAAVADAVGGDTSFEGVDGGAMGDGSEVDGAEVLDADDGYGDAGPSADGR